MKSIVLKFIILIFLNFVSNKENDISKKPHILTNVKNNPIKIFTPNIAEEFIALASYSYCDENKMYENKCCPVLNKNYEIFAGFTIPMNDYTFAILKNDVLKRIVLTFSGTKTVLQLSSEALLSYMIVFNEQKYNGKMYISRYANLIFGQVKKIIQPLLIQLQIEYPDYQYIFTGHSLGAQIATIAVLDSVINKYVKGNDYSPALINYASPRVGNKFFAEVANNKIPVIMRIAVKGDPVIHLPPCFSMLYGLINKYLFQSENKCSSNFGDSFKTNLQHENFDSELYYWHIPGLILYTTDMNSYYDCGREYTENNPNINCNSEGTTNTDYHLKYFKKSLALTCAGARRFKGRLSYIESLDKLFR